MNPDDLVALIQGGVASRGGKWADLGAGEGAFTFALAGLIGPGGQITAVDRDKGSMGRLAARGGGPQFAAIEAEVADFTRPLHLSGLDGVVMANSLHFVRDKGPVLDSVSAMLRPGGSLIVVEYGADRGNPWVPHPFSFPSWERLAAAAGFEGTRLLHTIPSRFLGTLYSSVSHKPLASGPVT